MVVRQMYAPSSMDQRSKHTLLYIFLPADTRSRCSLCPGVLEQEKPEAPERLEAPVLRAGLQWGALLLQPPGAPLLLLLSLSLSLLLWFLPLQCLCTLLRLIPAALH